MLSRSVDFSALSLSQRFAASIRANVGGLPSVYWYLWWGSFLNRMGTFVVPFLSLYLTRERGFSVESAGFAISLYGAGATLAGLFGGALADRLGRRATLVAALWLGSATMLNLGLARSSPALLFAAFAQGLCGELFRPAVSAAVADIVPAADRARAYGLLYWIVNLAYALAMPLAGLLVSGDFFTLFAADAATTFAYGVLVLLRVPETRPARLRREHPARAEVLAPLKDGVFLAFCLLTLLWALVFFQFNAMLPLDLTARGLSPAHYGFVMGLNGVLIVLLQPFASAHVGRVRRSTALALAAALTGVGFGLHAGPATILGTASAIAVWTLGEILQAPVAPAVVADLAPTHVRGAYQGVYHSLYGLAACLAPAIGGWVLQHFGPGALWSSCFALSSAVALAHLAIAGPRRRRITEIRAAHSEASGNPE